MLEKIGEDGRCSVYAESYLLPKEGIIGKARVLDLDDFEQVDFDANYSSPRDEHNLNTKYTSEFFYPYEIEQADTYAEDNPASLEDAVANMEKVVGYFYPGEPDVMVDRVELRSRLHKVKGIDDYNLGDYVEDYPSGTYNLSIREMMDGIPIYVDVGDRLSLDLASDKGKKGVNDFWRKNVKLWRVSNNYFEFMNKSRFELNTVWLKRVSGGGDFRSNIASGGRGEKYDADEKTIKTAEKIARILDLDYCGIDFLFSEQGMIVCEVNSNAFFKEFEAVTGLNVAKEYAKHIISCVE